ncbi:MAG TPA: cytochrome P450 [Actinomycetota bacterium]
MGTATIAVSDLSPLAALRAFRRDPIALLERLAALGDVVRLRVPGSDAFLLNHPDLVHEVLVAEHRAFHKGPTIQAAKLLLGESLLTSEGERHRRQRRLIQPMFHHERIAGYADAMVRRAELVASGWPDGAELDAHAEMASLTLGIVGETLFGADVDGERSATITRALTDTLSMFDRVYSPAFRMLVRLPTPTMRRYRRIEADLDRVIAELIAERRSAGASGDDLLSLLLRAEESGSGMTDEEVRDEALTLVLAGHETTSNALAWTWYLLAQHPAAEARLHAELDDALAGRPPSASDLPRLRGAEAVLSESIRLRPPAWAIGRRAIRDVRIGEVDVPEGAIVVVSPWLLHHDARWWRDPEAFVPERWTSGEATRRPRSAFVPFGGGPRMCVGEPFAWMEGTLLLATIARRWRLRLVPGRPVTAQAVVTLRPRGGLPMVAERRPTAA